MAGMGSTDTLADVVDPEPFLSRWTADFYTSQLAQESSREPTVTTQVTLPSSTASRDHLQLLGGEIARLDQNVPEDGDPWSGAVRIPARSLPGVTGVSGPALAAALSTVDLTQLSPAQLVEVMTGSERLARWAQGVQLAAVGAFSEYAVITDEDGRDDPLPGGGGRVEVGFGTQREIETFCADGVGAALGVSYTAGQQLIDAACFAAAVPGVADELAAGRVDLGRVKVLARELALVGYDTEEERTFVDEQVRGHDGLTPKKLEAKVRSSVMSRSPEQARQVRRREENTRGVWLSRQPAGMASLSLRLRADEALLAYHALNAAAWHHHDTALTSSGRDCEEGDYRSFDNFRADAFMVEMRDLQLRYLRHDPSGATSAAACETPDPEPAEPADGSSSAASETRNPKTSDTPNGLTKTSGIKASDTKTGSTESGDTETGARTPGSAEAGPAGRTVSHVDEGSAIQGPGRSNSDPPTPRSKRAARMMEPARVMLHLYMDAATLVGQADRPASLLGYGPVDADLARELASDATVVRLLTDPFTRHVQAIDLPAYRVPKILRWAVQARDRNCVFPGCDVPAYDTQLDHIDPHPFARKLRKAFATGSTTFTNLHNLCLRHHYLKTHGGWTIQTTRGSQLEWISPTGHSYRRNPEWGPPAGFWPDHDPRLPIDAPSDTRSRPLPELEPACPF